MSQYEINGVPLEIDMEDVEFQAKYEDAFEKLGDAEKELQKVGKISEITLGYCNMFYQLFDDIFGEGTGNKLFEGKKNSRMCDDIYSEFIGICSGQVEEANKAREQHYKKFQPNRNRAQRRATQRGK